jgi:hypothetical protein
VQPRRAKLDAIGGRLITTNAIFTSCIQCIPPTFCIQAIHGGYRLQMEWLTITQLAERSGLSTSRIKWLLRHGLPYKRFTPGGWHYVEWGAFKRFMTVPEEQAWTALVRPPQRRQANG